MIENHPLYAEQLELEAQMIASGMTSYFHAEAQAAAKGRASSTGVGSYLTTLGVSEVEARVTAFIAEMESGRRGRRGAAYPYLKLLPPAVSAAVAVKAMINYLSRPGVGINYLASPGRAAAPLVAVAKRVGEAVESEAAVAAYEKAQPDLVPAILAKLDKTTSHPAHRRRVILASMRKNNFEMPRWDSRALTLVGVKLIEAVVEVTGFFEVELIRSGKETTRHVRFTQAALDLIADRQSLLSRSMPTLSPMIIPPKPWDARGRDGGYYSPISVRPLKLVKRTYRELVPGDVVDAVNTLQNTPWRVNGAVLCVLKEVVDRRMDHLEVLPPVADVPIPEKPEDIATNEEARKKYRIEASRAYADNASRKAKRIAVYRTLGLAEQYVKYESIYFPHNIDFRGRAYPIAQWLHPQGPDLAKGLLQFAEGKPIGDEQGPGWLAIHGANSFGVDKVSFEERIDWVELHAEDIKRVACDPLQHLWWTEADSPWQFLAFCLEWAGYLDACAAGRGEHFLSHLPVMVDGTCNGIQHFSAMLRDPVGGKATNLVPSDKPSDIYGAVAEAVIARLSADTSEFAAKWMTFGIDRKITKRSVMVLPYGGKFISCRAYVEEAVLEAGTTPWAGDPATEKRAINYLAKVVWASIGDVVVGARSAMTWLQQMARLVMKSGSKSIWWRTPTGLKVEQRYREQYVRRIDTAFMGSVRVLISVTEVSDRPDKSRQVNGFSPNFVHSLDAAALTDTVNLAHDNGVSCFAAVHDSYGTHAADMAKLFACIRHAFVSLYENNDVLENLHLDIISQLPEGTEVPPPPPRGSLNIREVLKSDFFFA